VRIDGVSAAPRSAPPRLGEHTEHVLREILHYDAERVASLQQRGVI
jgi:formyl-CoA transferase